MNGYKTFAGIAIVAIAYLGWTDFILPAEISLAAKNIEALAGIILAVYGRIVAGKDFKVKI